MDGKEIVWLVILQSDPRNLWFLKMKGWMTQKMTDPSLNLGPSNQLGPQSAREWTWRLWKLTIQNNLGNFCDVCLNPFGKSCTDFSHRILVLNWGQHCICPPPHFNYRSALGATYVTSKSLNSFLPNFRQQLDTDLIVRWRWTDIWKKKKNEIHDQEVGIEKEKEL